MADDITVELEDTQDKWLNDWYPSKGDILELEIGYRGEKPLQCGRFEIDTINPTPSMMSIKAISTTFKKPVREKQVIPYKNTTLLKIAKAIAYKYGYKLVGTIKDVKIGRITQHYDSELKFLKELAQSYGYVFKITGSKMVFYSVEELEKAPGIMTLTRADLRDYNLQDSVIYTYSACRVEYYDAKAHKLYSATYTNPDVEKADTLKITKKCTNKAQALAMAKAELKRASYSVEGSITFKQGNNKACAGINFNFDKFGKLNGKYTFVSSAHIISKTGGYETSGRVKKLDALEPAAHSGLPAPQMAGTGARQKGREDD
jgi:phage protein D